MRDRLPLMIYAVSVIALSTIHDLGFLAGAVVVIFILAGRDAARVARRAGTAILIFTSIVSLSYAIVSSTRGQFSGSYLLRTNLRVFAMTSLTILLGLRLDVARACSFSPALGQLATLTAAQVRTFRRLGDDLRLALRSRSVAPLGFRDLQRHAAASGSLLLEQTIERSAEVTRAMRSRGAFDA